MKVEKHAHNATKDIKTTVSIPARSRGGGYLHSKQKTKETKETIMSTTEISGSVSVTNKGEIFIHSSIENYDLLFKLDAMKTRYKINLVAINSDDEKLAKPDIKGLTINNLKAAKKKIPNWLTKKVKLNLQEDTLHSIKLAIECSWRTPKTSFEALNQLVNEANKAITA